MATYIPFPRECGGTIHVRGEMRELRRRGHEVVLCARAEEGLAGGEVDGVPVHRFSWRYRDVWALQAVQRWAHGMRVARIARDCGADVIYERETSMGSGAIAASLARLPLVVEVNDTWWHPSSLERAARIISVTGSVRTVVPERHHHKTVFIHNAVDTSHFEGARRAHLEGAEGRRLVGYVGSLLAWHGIDDLAKALPLVLKEAPDATLLVAGEARTAEGARMLEHLRSAARDAGRPEGLLLLGRVPYDQLPGVLAACEVCVAPFNPATEPLLREYGFFYTPIKVWDYMAAGRAVVATAVENVREILADGRGLLVPPGDPVALARAISDLLGDGDLRDRTGRLAREHALRHSYTAMGAVYEDAILAAVHEGGGRAA